jgi:hypothetical protein
MAVYRQRWLFAELGRGIPTQECATRPAVFQTVPHPPMRATRQFGWCRFPNPVLDAFRAAPTVEPQRCCGLLLTGGDALRTATKKRLRLWPLWDIWGLRTLAECTAATMFCGAPICLHVVSGDVLVWMGARFPVGLRLWKSRDGRKFPKRAVDKKTRPAHIPRTGAPLVLRLDGAPPKPSLIIRWQSFRPRSAAGGFDAF